MSKVQKPSVNEKISGKKGRRENMVGPSTAPFTHAYVKFTGNRAHSNEYCTVPVFRIKGLKDDFSYDKLSEYSIYWRKPESDTDEDDERRATDDEDYYPGKIIKLGKSCKEIDDWLKKNEGRRIITPTVKSHIPAAEKPSKTSSTTVVEKTKQTTKIATQERKEKKAAVSASVDTNLQSVLKKVIKSQGAAKDNTNHPDSTKAKTGSAESNENEHMRKQNSAAPVRDDSTVVNRLLDNNEKLQEQITALTAYNASLRTEKEHLENRVRQLLENEKSLQCTIDLLRNDMKVDERGEGSFGSTKSKKPVQVMAKQESTQFWKEVEVDVTESDIGTGQATFSDGFNSSDEDTPVLKKRKVKTIEDSDDSSSDDEVFTREQITERKAWSASLVYGGGRYKEKVPLLKIKDNKVYLGFETWISVPSWTTIKKQAKDKMFMSHFAVALLGEDCYLYNKSGTSKDGRVMRKFPEKFIRVVSDFLWRKFMKDNDSNQMIAEVLLKKIDVAYEVATLVREKDPKRQEQKAEMRKMKSVKAKTQENTETPMNEGRNLECADD